MSAQRACPAPDERGRGRVFYSTQQVQRVPAAWNNGPDRSHGSDTVLERFREHAAARPDAVAATGGGCALTYRELASAARATARGLTAAGVRPGDRVAVLAERSALAAVALIAVWQAGAVYVPVDPDHPDERVRFLLSDCAARVVLTEPGLVARVPAGSAVLIEAGLHRKPRTERTRPRRRRTRSPTSSTPPDRPAAPRASR